MTTVHDLIDADATAKALAASGNDAGCAARLRAIYVQPRSYLITKRQLHQSFGFTRGVTILATLKAAAQSDVAAAEVVNLLESDVGLDIGHPDAAVLLAAWVAAELVTQSEANTLLALATEPLQVTAADVSVAWSQYRPNGHIQGA